MLRNAVLRGGFVLSRKATERERYVGYSDELAW